MADKGKTSDLAICYFDCYSVLQKVYGEGAYIKQAMADTVIAPKNRAAVTKICYGTLEKDIYLSYCLSALCQKTPKQSARIVLKIGMYAMRFLQTPPYAAVNACVELLGKMGKGGVSGFANALLRRFSTAEIPMPTKPIERMSVELSYPRFALERLIEDYGMETATLIASAEPPRTCLTFYGTDGEAYLSGRKIEYSKTPFENVYFADKFTRDEGFEKGVYTFQNIGSVAVCDVVKGGGRLLDCCAAPGGKSVRLAEKFVRVTACELYPHRAELIKGYSARMKVANITVETRDSQVFYAPYAESFDAVLCDAPCSGFGVAADNPDIKMNRSAENVSELTRVQLALLSNVCRYVKKGGALYYSTCSVFKAENDGVAQSFLAAHPDFSIEKTTSPLTHMETAYGLQFLPNLSCGAGFFVAKFIKI